MVKTDKKQKIKELRHKIVYAITINIVKPYFKLIHYSYDKPRHFPKPTIVLANHNTDLDTLLVSVCFKDQMYFIASENCFRKGIKSKFLIWGYDPISKIKGASDTLAVMKAIRALKEGKNICLFPEGGRSFTGITTPVQIATGKLVKISEANLVTFKIQGGYMKIPRWGFGMRKGSWNGNIVNFYTSEQLKQMTPQQITDCINQDLYEDAYKTQEERHIKYSGKDLAAGMECAVCVCPECMQIGTIETKGNSIYCNNCKTSTEINDYSFFEPGFKFKSVAEWDLWQEDFFKQKLSEPFDGAFLADNAVSLRTFDSNHNTTELGTGKFELTKNSFIFTADNSNPITLPIKDIPDASVFSRSNFNFTNNKNGLHYELYADRLINVRKYYSCWKIIRDKIKE